MEPIIINLSNPHEKLTLPFSIKESFDIQMSPQSEEILMDISDFPRFIKLAVQANMALVQAYATLNMVIHSLIPDVDPFRITLEMDNLTLEELDIKEQYNIDSIN